MTSELALRLGKLPGNGPELWLRMQMARDLWRLERTLRADLAASRPTARREGSGGARVAVKSPDPVSRLIDPADRE